MSTGMTDGQASCCQKIRQPETLHHYDAVRWQSTEALLEMLVQPLQLYVAKK